MKKTLIILTPIPVALFLYWVGGGDFARTLKLSACLYVSFIFVFITYMYMNAKEEEKAVDVKLKNLRHEKDFEDWYYEIENFSYRCERLAQMPLKVALVSAFKAGLDSKNS